MTTADGMADLDTALADAPLAAPTLAAADKARVQAELKAIKNRYLRGEINADQERAERLRILGGHA